VIPLIVAALLAGGVVGSAVGEEEWAESSLEEIGRQIYQDGLRASGEPLVGSALGGAAIAGSCASCHRPSGFGTLEGGAAVPAVTGEALFGDGVERRADLFRRLYLEPGPPGLLAAARADEARPAYTVEGLGRTLREGVDPGGRALDPLMPRYALDDREVAALAAYLAGLGAGPAPGVDAEEIRFATVLAPGIGAGRQRDHLGVLTAYVERHNRDVENLLARPGASPHHRDDFAVGYRRWRLEVWRLQGEPETWRRQLDALHAARPVFALLGGLGEDEWGPVHGFCEERAVPCLFADVPLPPAEAGEWSLYHDRGIAGEAAALAAALAEGDTVRGRSPGERGAGDAGGGSAGAPAGRGGGVASEAQGQADSQEAPPASAEATGPIFQVWRSGDAVGEAAAAAFRAALPPALAARLVDRPLHRSAEPDAAFWRSILGTAAGAASPSHRLATDAGRAGAAAPSASPARSAADAPGPAGAAASSAAAGAPPATLVLWLDRWPDALPADLAPRLAAIHLSYRLLGDTLPPEPPPLADKVRLTWPYALPGEAAPHAHRVHAWLRSRGLPPGDERLQRATWWTAAVLDDALAHMVDRFDRAWLVERVEHEAELVPDPGVFPPLSLGPGQRFASKGLWIVRLDPAAPGGVAPVGPWRRVPEAAESPPSPR
jgi:mono/diheme cytochrome c family protein